MLSETNQTSDETLNQLDKAWSRLHGDILLLLWIIELLRNSKEHPISDEAINLNAVEKHFRDFCASMNQTTDFRFDRLGGLMCLITSITVGLFETRKALHQNDQKTVDEEFTKIFGCYETQIDRFKIDVTLMNSEIKEDREQKTALTILHRVRNSLSHGRYEINDKEIIVKDQTSSGEQTADFRFEHFYFLDYAYSASHALLKTFQQLELYKSKSNEHTQ